MISIILATCYRPDYLENMLRSLSETTKDYDIEVVAAIDNDRESLYIAEEYGVDAIDFRREKRGALKAWNDALHLSDGDVIVPAGDDQLFYPNWLDFALESHWKKLQGYGVIGMNDLAYDGNTQLATMLLFDRKYCREVMGGVFAPPVYNYFCVDSEWNAKAKMLGRYFWDKRAVIEHLHVAHGKRPLDLHDQLKIDNKWATVDNAMFEQRMIQGFPISWESVI